MKNFLSFQNEIIDINWDTTCTIIENIKDANYLQGIANNIPGEVFFYQNQLDIQFDGTQKEVFEVGDVVYWRSTTETNKFGILFMYGNTTYGDGTKPRTSSPGIKIGTISVKDLSKIADIKSGTQLQLG
ncbi:cyclophilin-like family protein [Tenacibaculum agarivorans]|uniref:cyclophilin-like family protein n=1 Tax=Tenacibaculum agarivorans TaxID=1908389 RepID=UPI00094BB2FD|nr:cyclophilin-like family protein [Tenacibaculum agarivorans]